MKLRFTSLQLGTFLISLAGSTPLAHAIDTWAPEESSIETEEANPAESLLIAIFNKDAERFKELAELGHDVHATDDSGISLMHHAAALGELEIMQMLIDKKVDLNLRTQSRKSTAAHSAVLFGQLEALVLLAEAGADLTLTNAAGQTPGQMAEDFGFQDIVDYLKSLEASAPTPSLN